MKQTPLILLTTIFVLAIAHRVSGETNSVQRRFSLTKLREFYDNKEMDRDAKVQRLIGYLRQELAQPSSPGMGVGGGPIDTIYIQDVIIRAMAETVPPETLLKAFNQETDRKMKDRIMVALVGAGDQTFVDDLLSLLRNQSDTLFRLAGVRALAKTKNKDVVPTIELMRDDTYSRIAFRHGDYHKVYPVRQAAHEAIVDLGAKSDNWTLEVPLRAGSDAEAAVSILADENPEQSVALLQSLDKHSVTNLKGTLQKFVSDNAAKPSLARPVEEARRILKESER